MTEDLVVVLTALNFEHAAVRRRMLDPQVRLHDQGTLFEIGTLRGTDCQIALALTDKGNHAAAVLAERAINEYQPAAVMFVGVAGALHDSTQLGDVVVAKHVYAYHGGTSEDDGLKSRPRVWETEHGISQLASHVDRRNDWFDHTDSSQPCPTVHFGSIAAGEVVHNSQISSEAQWIRQHYNDALAIEMEAAGIAQAGHLNGSPVAVVRGISDRADGTKTTDADRTWQPRAADNAAAFAMRLAQEFINQREQRPMRNRNEGDNGNVTNTAHSVVGIQARNVTNSHVRVTGSESDASSVDLAAELASIRDELGRARSTGTLDTVTCDNAQEELDHAEHALKESVDQSRNRLVLALKRLYGLVLDASEVASKVATLIAAAKDLS